MAARQKVFSAAEVLNGLETGEFDDDWISEPYDSDEEPMEADLVVDGGILVDLVDLASLPIRQS